MSRRSERQRLKKQQEDRSPSRGRSRFSVAFPRSVAFSVRLPEIAADPVIGRLPDPEVGIGPVLGRVHHNSNSVNSSLMKKKN